MVTGEALRAVLGKPELIAGFSTGLVAAVAGLAVAATGRWPRPAPVAGTLFTAAFAVALALTRGLPAGLAVGLVVLVAAGAVRRSSGSLPLAVAGAWLVLWGSGLALGSWWRPPLLVAVVLAGLLMADLDDRWGRHGLGLPLLAITVAGIYTTVPDTEQALVALGAVLPLALLAWPWPLASLGRGGAFATSGVVLWVLAAGGVGRGSAVVGGVVCLGLLAVEPVARLLDPAHDSVLECLPGGRPRVVLAATLHLGLVFIGARVVGLQPTVLAAVAIGLPVALAAVVLALAATANRRRLSAPGRGEGHLP